MFFLNPHEVDSNFSEPYPNSSQHLTWWNDRFPQLCPINKPHAVSRHDFLFTVSSRLCNYVIWTKYYKFIFLSDQSKLCLWLHINMGFVEWDHCIAFVLWTFSIRYFFIVLTNSKVIVRVKQQRWVKWKSGGGGGDGRGWAAEQDDEKNDMANWQQDENGLMGDDSYEIIIGKMSKHDTMIDRWGGKKRGEDESKRREKSGRNTDGRN